MRIHYTVFVILGLLMACSGEAQKPITGEVAQPQLAVNDDALLLLWRSPANEGSDLFVARYRGDQRVSDPVRVNDIESSVSSFDLDELRPSMAIGPGGLLAVAWGDNDGDVRVALSRDQGATFAPSVLLNQDAGDAAQSFPSVAFDPSGALPCGSIRG